MLSHVRSIPFIALHSTHTALLLLQSPLLLCRRNISFPANSYPLKRRKFHFAFQCPSGILPPENFSTPPPLPTTHTSPGGSPKRVHEMYTAGTEHLKTLHNYFVPILLSNTCMYVCVYVCMYQLF